MVDKFFCKPLLSLVCSFKIFGKECLSANHIFDWSVLWGITINKRYNAGGARKAIKLNYAFSPPLTFFDFII